MNNKAERLALCAALTGIFVTSGSAVCARGEQTATTGSAAMGVDNASVSTAGSKAAVTRHFDQDYKAWEKELKQYVQFGNIHYKRWKAHQSGLDKFLKAIEHLDPREYEQFTRNEKLAFWLNVYNALIIKTVLDYYPIHGTISIYPPDSFRQIPNEWESVKFKVMGKDITLYTIEHEKIRRDLADPRTHFAEVCASRGCAEISTAPFTGLMLDEQLDRCTRRFMADADNVLIDPVKNEFQVSKIFSWFTLDFMTRKKSQPGKPFSPPSDDAIIADYITPYLSEKQAQQLAQVRQFKNLKFDYLPYDWGLNDADVHH